MKRNNAHTLVAIPALLIVLLIGYGSLVAGAQNPSSPQSAPAASSLMLHYASLNSPALGKELKFAVMLPASYELNKKQRYPVLYFLHGMNGTELEFERRGVAAAVNKLHEAGKLGEMIIVAPAGQNSFYLNAKNGLQYEDAIIKDLIPYIEQNYRTVGKPAGRAIQGLSMGGFGALLLAFKHPEMFSSVTAHSSAIFIELPKPSGSDRRAQFLSQMIGRLFGEPPDEDFFRANNPVDLGDSNAAAIKKAGLKIYFDVGDQDRYGFTEPNRQFSERLQKAGIQHEFHVFPGGHGWEYMISVADKSYGFLWNHLQFSGKPKLAASAKSQR